MSVTEKQGIFESFYQWGKVKEDFYSNSLVYILKQLRRYERGKELATNLLNSLFDNKLSLSDEWDIRGHTVSNETRDIPDIEIESDKALVYIEVKVRSGVNYNQLRRYRNELKRTERKTGKRAAIFLLTAFGWDDDKGIPDMQLSWVKVWECLGEVESQIKPEKEDEIAHETYYLVRDFRRFLKEEGMGVEQMSHNITKESLEDLRKFLSIILAGCREQKLKPVSQWQLGYWGEGKVEDRSIGWYFYKDRKKEYWCGLGFDYPMTVSFEVTGNAYKRLKARTNIDPKIERRLKTKFPNWWLGEGDEWAEFPYDLPKNFVQLEAEKQVQVISNFVKDVLESTGERRKSR